MPRKRGGNALSRAVSRDAAPDDVRWLDGMCETVQTGKEQNRNSVEVLDYPVRFGQVGSMRQG